MTQQPDITFDVSQTPFSRFGSFMSLMIPPKNRTPSLGPGLYLQSHRSKVAASRYVALVELLEGGQVVAPDRIEGTPTVLTMHGPGRGRVRLCFSAPDTLRVRGEGAGLRFRVPTPWGVIAQPVDDKRWSVNARHAYSRYLFECLAGHLQADAPWRPQTCQRIVLDLLPDDSGVMETAIDAYQSTWIPRERPPFPDCLSGVADAFERFCAGMPTTPAALHDARRQACYVDWSCTVSPDGFLRRPTMFMSKVVMDQVWSWDHCFNAMACLTGQPQLAWDQFLVVFDHQDEYGALPDAVDCLFRHYNYSKPPIHGWALGWMMRRHPEFFDRQRLLEIYEPLGRLSRWWTQHRTRPQDRLPHYLHGHDGWDNSTMFDAGAPLIAPDLAAVLALQFDTLADLASRLGRPGEAREHRERAQRLVDALVGDLWRGDQFVAQRLADGCEVPCRSLIVCIPIILAERLPSDVRRALVARIRTFLTEHGLATEQPDSPHYQADGYWRGPIWAPCTMMIVDGLVRSGEVELARTIAERFCRMCARSGFAENFDALTGAPLRDTAYTWTASVFLILAHQLLEPGPDREHP